MKNKKGKQEEQKEWQQIPKSDTGRPESILDSISIDEWVYEWMHWAFSLVIWVTVMVLLTYAIWFLNKGINERMDKLQSIVEMAEAEQTVSENVE